MSQKFIPNAQYNPEFQQKITAKTLLAPGIPMARFLGGTGTRATIDHITANQTVEDKMKLAKQLHMQAIGLYAVSREKEFDFYRIRVSEGYYRLPDPTKKYDTDSILYLRNKGQAIVYEIRGEDGTVDIEKSFDLALFFATNKIGGCRPQKTILSYDNFNPDGTIDAQVTLIMPECSGDWSLKYNGVNKVETKWNGYSQSSGELIEILYEERKDQSVLYDIAGKN